MTAVLALGLVTALFSLLLKSQQKEIAAVLSISASVFLFLYVMQDISKVLTNFRQAAYTDGIEEEIQVLSIHFISDVFQLAKIRIPDGFQCPQQRVGKKCVIFQIVDMVQNHINSPLNNYTPRTVPEQQKSVLPGIFSVPGAEDSS